MWHRGEYQLDLIRRYIPKKSSFEKLTQEKLNEIENKLNNRPRKKLNFLYA
jgi:IS30 family transposase